MVTLERLADRIAHPLIAGAREKGNVALLEPAETVTEAGMINDVLLVLNATRAALAAADVSVTVQVPPAPGAKETGEQVKVESEDADGESAIGKVTAV